MVRDFYHRYTVDEHSFLAIENLHRLKESQSEWDRRFALLLSEIEQPEIIYLALLLHDSGKAAQGENHFDVSAITICPSVSMSAISILHSCLETSEHMR